MDTRLMKMDKKWQVPVTSKNVTSINTARPSSARCLHKHRPSIPRRHSKCPHCSRTILLGCRSWRDYCLPRAELTRDCILPGPPSPSLTGHSSYYHHHAAWRHNQTYPLFVACVGHLCHFLWGGWWAGCTPHIDRVGIIGHLEPHFEDGF